MDSSDSARAKANPYRRKILSGEPLSFSGNEPAEKRTIQAEWLAEAARKPAKIDVRNAVILGTLNLQYVTFEEEVSLIGCDIEQRAEFSNTTFKRNLVLSRTTFHQGATFERAKRAFAKPLSGGCISHRKGLLKERSSFRAAWICAAASTSASRLTGNHCLSTLPPTTASRTCNWRRSSAPSAKTGTQMRSTWSAGVSRLATSHSAGSAIGSTS